MRYLIWLENSQTFLIISSAVIVTVATIFIVKDEWIIATIMLFIAYIFSIFALLIEMHRHRASIRSMTA